MEKVRGSRWLLAPMSTARMRRRMILWEITSYRRALELTTNGAERVFLERRLGEVETAAQARRTGLRATPN